MGSEGRGTARLWVSPAQTGRVGNPMVWAELRRWRARPFSYCGIVLITLLGICLLLYGDKIGEWIGTKWARRTGGTFGLLASMTGGGKWAQFLKNLLQLIIRPSTVLPLMMVWRALVSFRDGGLYEPFRTTFLTPGEFLWGIIAVPFLASGVILVAYTGIVLGPQLIDSFYYGHPHTRGSSYYLQIMAGILYEGSANGALICLLALFFGLRGGARLSALGPVFIALLAVQVGHGFFFMYFEEAQAFLRLPALPPATLSPLEDHRWRYLLPGTAKLLLCIALWGVVRWNLRNPE